MGKFWRITFGNDSKASCVRRWVLCPKAGKLRVVNPLRVDPADHGGPTADGPAVDKNARPHWARTGYRFFPYAAQQSGQWWVLRLNPGFPEHDMYTLFSDGRPVADLTGNPDDSAPLVASVASLQPYGAAAGEPVLDAETAKSVVSAVSSYVNYGAEHDDPCIFCSDDRDGMAR